MGHRRAQPVSGPESLVGRETVVRAPTGQTTGRVQLEGGWWTARSRGGPLREGDAVRVVGLEDLNLIVEPVQCEEPTEESQ